MKTQVTDTIKIYGPRRMRRLGMEKNKEGRRKSAKKVDYNLMLLHAQKLQEGAECCSLGWGLLQLGWAGEGRWEGASLLYFLRGGTCPEQNATERMCRHDLRPTAHRASAFLAHRDSLPWDPE